MNIEYNFGIIEDPRTEAQKALDYSHAEGSVSVNWVEKSPDQWKKYTAREQDGSLSCCAQATAKAFEILDGQVQSAHPIYRSRSNFPDGGMYLQNVGDVAKNIGTTLESLDASQWENENTMNRPITVPTPTKIATYKFVPSLDIDSIAEAIALAGHCLIIFHCNKGEWTAIPTYTGAEFNFGHCVCAVDYFTYKGEKYILIEDSTGHFNTFDKNGQRLLTADFLTKRCAGAMYFTLDKFQFTQTLKMGSTGYEVKKLQEFLKISADGKFGNITKNSLIAFQYNHQLQPDGILGSKSRAVVNSLI